MVFAPDVTLQIHCRAAFFGLRRQRVEFGAGEWLETEGGDPGKELSPKSGDNCP